MPRWAATKTTAENQAGATPGLLLKRELRYLTYCKPKSKTQTYILYKPHLYCYMFFTITKSTQKQTNVCGWSPSNGDRDQDIKTLHLSCLPITQITNFPPPKPPLCPQIHSQIGENSLVRKRHPPSPHHSSASSRYISRILLSASSSRSDNHFAHAHD